MVISELVWWVKWRRFRRQRLDLEFRLFATFQTAEWQRVKEENRLLGLR